MILSDDEKRLIEEISQRKQEEQIERIKKISLSAWDGYLDSNTLRSWLKNFSGEALNNSIAEQNLALWMVENFIFYTDRDVRALCKNLWWKYIHYHLDEYEKTGYMSEASIEEKCSYIINHTIIQPLGNCSGSGTNIAYFFRQSNNISPSVFNLLSGNRDYKYLALIDDATLSGYQAEENLQKYNSITDKDKIIITLISTNTAKEHIKTKACLISSVELDERIKCFTDNSFVFFNSPEVRNLAKRMCAYYGNKLYKRNALGYRRGQYAIGFYYNIPNNSLPIFWSTENNWIPLFTRYFSTDDSMEVYDSEKYV